MCVLFIVTLTRYCFFLMQHSVGVIHRDLKSENVFFSDPTTIKVGDFGFSTLASRTKLLDTFCGSPPYSSPELFQGEPYPGPCVDIWALGVMLYFMSSGNIPFRGDTVPEIKDKVLSGTYHMPTVLSEECQTLVAGMLCYNAKERYTMADIASSRWMLSTAATTKARDGGGVAMVTSGDSLVQTNKQQQSSSTMHEPTTHQNQLIDEELQTADDTLDETVIELIRSLGVPFDTNELLGEPRTPAAGTYRILLHRKREQRGTRSDHTQHHTPNSTKRNESSVTVTLTNERCSLLLCCGTRSCTIL